MAWSGFFSRNPFKTGLGIFGTGLTVGLSISTWLAFETRDKCAAAALALIHHLGHFILIPSVSGEINIGGDVTNFTLTNVNITEPASVTHIIGEIEHLPDFCFNITFYTGLIVSILASATIANAAVTQLMAHSQRNYQRAPFVPLINSDELDTPPGNSLQT